MLALGALLISNLWTLCLLQPFSRSQIRFSYSWGALNLLRLLSHHWLRLERVRSSNIIVLIISEPFLLLIRVNDLHLLSVLLPYSFSPLILSFEMPSHFLQHSINLGVLLSGSHL